MTFPETGPRQDPDGRACFSEADALPSVFVRDSVSAVNGELQGGALGVTTGTASDLHVTVAMERALGSLLPVTVPSVHPRVGQDPLRGAPQLAPPDAGKCRGAPTPGAGVSGPRRSALWHTPGVTLNTPNTGKERLDSKGPLQ